DGGRAIGSASQRASSKQSYAVRAAPTRASARPASYRYQRRRAVRFLALAAFVARLALAAFPARLALAGLRPALLLVRAFTRLRGLARDCAAAWFRAAVSAFLAVPRKVSAVRCNATPAAAIAAARIASVAMSRTAPAPDSAASTTFAVSSWVMLFFSLSSACLP